MEISAGDFSRFSRVDVLKVFCFYVDFRKMFFAIVLYWISIPWVDIYPFDLKSQSHGEKIDQNFIVKCQILWVCRIPLPEGKPLTGALEFIQHITRDEKAHTLKSLNLPN